MIDAAECQRCEYEATPLRADQPNTSYANIRNSRSWFKLDSKFRYSI